ncbi:bifunctional nicotinamidase/pyrazinamidase [Candidatus Puniceispirillum marinum]|uniref:Nicotinamidase n=1 Tax=Puniceispirillum marinum (strain IMCC1322) TaxID=488538 RepID=D5BN71_PUNMI|nr:bifunctional nicotinamidase/pyrazinamidase [Candidatus Puniceispirillum marinum]ADE40264.1 pyrazinamidase/nicotinamidase [Candidatus Puniceispirillum marinum IMCC1322]
MSALHALIVIDPQVDFCPGGALAVADGHSIMPHINAMMPAFDKVFITQDWHPEGHSSFASQHAGATPYSMIDMSYGPQTLWPDHCIAGSAGAAFHPDLNTDLAVAIIRKGMNPEVDSYSAFFENDRTTTTGLGDLLRAHDVASVTLVGLATDFCVAWSALDAAKLGFNVAVELKACRAIDLDGSLDQAFDAMRSAGVTLKH